MLMKLSLGACLMMRFFRNYEQLQIVEKLVKTCYMDGLTDDCVNEVIMKLTDDFMD